MRWLCVLVICGGCLAGVPVRTAELTPRGETRLMINLTLAGYADARVVGDGVVAHGNAIWKLPPIMQALVTGFLLTGADVTVSTGLNDHCEVGVRISVYRGGGEVRCGTHDERTAVAGSFELATPWLLGSYPVDDAWIRLDPWTRLGFEISDRHGERVVLAAIHVSDGPEISAIPIPDQLSRGQRFEGPGAYALVRRREFRLTEVLGVGLDPESDGGPDLMLLGIVPYQVFDPGAPTLKCPMCVPGIRFDEPRMRRGVTVVGGISPF